jgi:aminoglycoside phosphotransferase (APT) family kinase protein
MTVEEPLYGGIANRGRVVRSGDTVRRPMRPGSAATHALLQHLESAGFSGSPRLLGVDEQGREVLSYIEGEAVVPPYPAWAMTDAALVSVARLLRDYHEATLGFRADQQTWSDAVPWRFRGHGVTTHNDPNLDNVVFRDGRAVALIDFDLASPGSRAWDVACAARLWAPLRSDVDITDSRRGAGIDRFRRFVDSYGLDAEQREMAIEAVPVTHEWCYAIVREGAESGGSEGFADYWAHGGADRAERTRAWYADTFALLRGSLA